MAGKGKVCGKDTRVAHRGHILFGRVELGYIQRRPSYGIIRQTVQKAIGFLSTPGVGRPNLLYPFKSQDAQREKHPAQSQTAWKPLGIVDSCKSWRMQSERGQVWSDKNRIRLKPARRKNPVFGYDKSQVICGIFHF
jgi:hypothetical protein